MAGPAGTKGKIENAVNWALFSLCFILGLYWAWVRINEINTYLGREVIKPVLFIVGIFCCPLLLYIYWLLVAAVREMEQKAGLPAKDEKVIDMIALCLCLPFGVYRVQQKLNAIWQK